MAGFRCNEFELSVIESESEGLRKLDGLWQDMGFDAENVETRKAKVRFYLKELIGRMVDEQNDEKVALISEIEELLKNADRLSKELKVQINVNVDEEIPLLTVKAILEQRLADYVRCRAERVERLRSLNKQADELAAVMGKIDLPFLSEVPSEEDLDGLKKLLCRYSVEKNQRMEALNVIRKKVLATMTKMELTPELDFERRVVEGDGFVLSLANMDALRELDQTMERRLAETNELVTELREKVSLLWERLNEPIKLRESFLLGFEGIGKSTIAALRAEIRRCEEKKRANIKQFVLAVRGELESYWEKCHFSVEQRDEFKHFRSDLFVEDLLDFHEQELDRVKQFYKDNLRLFSLLENWRVVWGRKSELEIRSNSPSRLYDNRGGKLLQEEKERKTILRKLPKIEEELRLLAQQYEDVKGEPFVVDGLPLTDFLTSQWAEHEAKKESQKQERKERNHTVVDGGLSAGKGSKRKAGVTPSATRVANQGSLAKRARPEVKMALFPPVNAPASAAKEVPASYPRVTRKAIGSKIALKVHQRPGQQTAGGDQNRNPNLKANNTTYTEFQTQLENGMATRSSAKLTARDCNASCRAGTPLHARTPVGGRTPGARTPLCARTPFGSRTPARTPLGARSPAALSVAKSRLYTPARNQLPFLI